MAIIAVGILGFWYFPYIPSNGDINTFLGIAKQISQLREGTILSFGLDNGYPPLASSLFFWINRIPLFSFYINWTATVVLLTALTIFFTERYYGDHTGYQFVFALIYSALLINPEFLFGRFDYLIVILLYLSLKAYQANYLAHAALFVVFGVFIKIVPIVVLPILIIKSFKRKKIKQCILGIIIGILVAIVIPLFTIGYRNSWRNISFLVSAHAHRGIQVESTWSALHMAISNMQGAKDELSFHNMASHNVSVWEMTPIISLYIGTIGLAILYVLAFFTEKSYQQLALSAILWCLFIAPVFSPQYIIWVLPLLTIELLERIREGKGNRVSISTLLLLVTILLIGYLTQYVYLSDYPSQKRVLPVILLNLRNFSIPLCLLLVLKRREKTYTN